MSNAVDARQLLRSHRYGALCTLSKKLDGYPFGSIVPYLVDHDGSLLILISALAEHTKNIQHDPRVSLITHNQSSPDIQMQGRVTVAGNAQRINGEHDARYLRHFPEAADLLQLDFAFYRITPVAIRYIGGIGRIHWINMADYAVLHAPGFALQESFLLDEINTQQKAIVSQLLLQHHGISAFDAKVIAFDCDGLDVYCDDRILRLNFEEPLTDSQQLLSLSTINYRPP